MKAILIRVAIILFVRWLLEDKDVKGNNLVDRIFTAGTHLELIKAFEHESTEKDIDEIVTDIENETISSVASAVIGKQ